MHPYARALLWQIIWRARWGCVAAGAFLFVAVVLVHLLPRDWTIDFTPIGKVSAPGWFFGISCLFINFLLMTVFTMSDPDMRNLTYARHLFFLPVRTKALVFWPMLSGCLTMAGVWLITAFLIFGASGIQAQRWAPAAGFALLLATLQALSWTPFAQRWLHILLTVVLLTTPILVLLILISLNVRLSEPLATIVLLALLPIAYLAAVSGVAMARRGDAYDWKMWSRLVDWYSKRRKAGSRPFGSIVYAQLWYECRSHLIVLFSIACMLPCFLFIPALDPHNVGLGWRLLACMLGIPLFLGMMAGGALGHLNDPLSKSDGSFVLVRPISSQLILRCKLTAAVVMTAAIWVFILGFISLLLTRPGFPQSIGQLAGTVPVWKAVGAPVLVVTSLMFLTWKNMVESLWINLTGRKWVEMANSFALVGLIFVGIASGLWISFHPELQQPALDAVPWLTGLLLLLKLILAVFIVKRLLNARLASGRAITAMVALWLTVVALIGATTLYLIPDGPAMASSVFPGIALLIPFSRLAGAPLALEWNRHR